MPRIPQETVDKLNQIPLTLVMENNGYTISHRTDNAVFYCCPFHPEKEGSFKVDRYPMPNQKQDGVPLAGYHCFGCGESGYGALMLQAALMRKKLGKDFRLVAEELAKIENLVLEGDERAMPVSDSLAKLGNLVVNGDHKNGFFHRAKPYAEPVDELCYVAKDEFSHADLRSLGCQVKQVFRRDWQQAGREVAMTEDGKPAFKYSFDQKFYSPNKESNFTPKMLTDRFNLYPVSEFITEKRKEKNKDGAETGHWASHHVVSTDTYPVFVFRYEDKDGWWCRKYEPLFRTTENSKTNYKFTWWYQGGMRRDEEMSTRLYGDVDVMRALETEEVKTCDKERRVVDVKVKKKDGSRTIVKKFEKLVICSGPRDAINVYFHSNVHVCFPHSETVEVPVKSIHRLREIAEEIYVLFDTDETGIKRANRLAMRFLDIKIIYLPKELKTLRSVRTGQPCKDAEEYFNYFPTLLKGIDGFYGQHINDHFMNLLIDAKPMRFWDKKETRHNKNTEDEYVTTKYTMNVDNMNQFLSASGMCVYNMGREVKFVDVGADNVVDIVEKDEATIRAKKKMKNYLKNNRVYNDPDLSNAISDTKRLNLSNLSEMSEGQLNFRSWGEDFDYLFFGNGAVRVTKDGFTKEPYSRMTYHTNREAILQDVEFLPMDMTRFFKIELNPHAKAMEDEFNAKRYAEKDPEKRRQLTNEYNTWKKLWKYRLVLGKDFGSMEQLPPLVQFIYDLGRIYWREEEAGMELPLSKKQFQDMHFINKFIGLGYILSRFRTDRRQQMVVLTDYSQAQGGKAYGRNGKSTFIKLLKLVRKGLDDVPGKQFLTDAANFAKNFTGFQQTVHAYVHIEDLRADMKDDAIYNLVQQLPVKDLYQNVKRIPMEESPKIAVTMNHRLDVESPSTYGRMWPMLASDYYHDESFDGGMELRTPETKFGRDIISMVTEEEANFNRNLLAYALQCYFWYISTQEKGVIRPPMDEDGKRSVMRSTLSKEEGPLYDWAVNFFSHKWHYERPIAVREMVISYLDYTGQEVTSDNTSHYSRTYKQVSAFALKYCARLDITVNPDVVYKSPTQKSERRVRTVTWETVFGIDGKPLVPRVRRKGESKEGATCWYFYKKGDEPKQSDHVLPAPDQDPDY